VKKLIAVLLTSLIWVVIGHGNAFAADPSLQFTQISNRDVIWDITNAGDGSGRLFLAEGRGRIFVIEDGEELQTPFLDIQDIVNYNSTTQGFFSVAFAPDYRSSGYLYVWFTASRSEVVLARFKVSDDPNIIDAGSRETILTVAKTGSSNVSGRVRFGPDGLLYLSLGDDGRSEGYENNNAQDGSKLLGKVMRIDVDPVHGTYAIPPTNPFVGDGAVRDEIWALGVSNPWRISFDRANGDLYISDFGPEWSEINFQDARSSGGENYGWNIMEGSSCILADCNQAGLTLPVAEYIQELDTGAACEVTGGEVYRGNAYPNLKGVYLYGDVCSGKIWGLTRTGNRWESSLLAETGYEIITFGLGEDGSLYVADWGGGVYLISDGKVMTEPDFAINAGFTDAWYFPSTSGQGFLIVAWEGIKTMFVAWFTYDVERPAEDAMAILGEPGHRWITAQGPFDGATATLNVYNTSGGVFDSAEPAVGPPERIGTMTITWTDCNTGVVSYDIPSLGLMQNVPIQRIVRDNIPLCQALQ